MWAPSWRAVALNVGAAFAGGVAVLGFATQHAVDLYALYDQMNVVVAEITKAIAMLTPLVTAAYALYKSTAAQKLSDLSADPSFKGAVVTPELASAVPSGKVVGSVAELPAPAHSAGGGNG